MNKKVCGLLVILVFFCLSLVILPVSHAMMKSTGIVHDSIIVKRDGDKLTVQWQYETAFQNRSLEGTKVQINLYQNGQFLQTIAESVAIGQHGRGSYRSSWDWGNKNVFVKGQEYAVEIVSKANSNVRAMSSKVTCEEDCGKVVMPGQSVRN